MPATVEDRAPLSLSHDNCDSSFQRLRRAKSRLFSDTETRIRLETVVHAEGQAPRDVVTDVVTDDYLITSVLQKHLAIRGDSFIFLFQDYSWAPFNLSEEAFRQITTTIKVLTAFYRLFEGFGHPDEGYETDFSGGYDCYLEDVPSGPMDGDARNSPTADFAYTLRYIAKTGRKEHPWSERKMGVYHRFDASTSVWIILQPTAAALGLANATSTRRSISPILSHILLFQSTLPAWKAYLKHVEVPLRNNSRRARISGETDPKLALICVQDLQYHSELLHKLISGLRSNIETLVGLRSLSTTIYDAAILHHKLSTCISQFMMNQKWAEDILDQSKQVSNLMSMLFYARHNEALTTNTTVMAQLARSSKTDQNMMLSLTREGKKDSETMKIIAIVSVIYLPFSFVTSVFSTGFVSSALSSGDAVIYSHVVTQAIVYVLVTISLTILTGLASYLWHKRVLLTSNAS